MLWIAIGLYVIGMVPSLCFVSSHYPDAPRWQILLYAVTWPLWCAIIALGVPIKMLIGAIKDG